MDTLEQYTIPVKGLGFGEHEFSFHIDRHFFKHFEQSPIKDGSIELSLIFDKRVDLFELQFDFEGTVLTHCDRCLDELDLQVADSQRLLVKLSLEDRVEEAEVVYISPDVSHLNVAKYAYEFISLAMPLIKVHENLEDCNPDMIAYLEGNNSQEQEEDSNPIWEELKKFKNDG